MKLFVRGLSFITLGVALSATSASCKNKSSTKAAPTVKPIDGVERKRAEQACDAYVKAVCACADAQGSTILGAGNGGRPSPAAGQDANPAGSATPTPPTNPVTPQAPAAVPAPTPTQPAQPSAALVAEVEQQLKAATAQAAKLREQCDLAKALPEALTLAADFAQGGNTKPQDVARANANMRSITSECIEQSAKLPTLGCR